MRTAISLRFRVRSGASANHSPRLDGQFGRRRYASRRSSPPAPPASGGSALQAGHGVADWKRRVPRAPRRSRFRDNGARDWNDAFERLLRRRAQAVVIGELDRPPLARAIEDHVLHLLRQVLPRRVEFGTCSACRARSASARNRARDGLRPGRDRALAQGQRLGPARQILVDRLLDAEAVRRRAGAGGIVEREQPRLDLGMVKPETGQANFREEKDMARRLSCRHFSGFHRLRRRGAAAAIRKGGRRRRQFQRGSKPRPGAADVGPHDDAVDDDVDVVLEFLVERRRVGDLVELPSILDALEALLLYSAISLRYSPLRPRTTGASRIERVPRQAPARGRPSG